MIGERVLKTLLLIEARNKADQEIKHFNASADSMSAHISSFAKISHDATSSVESALTAQSRAVRIAEAASHQRLAAEKEFNTAYAELVQAQEAMIGGSTKAIDQERQAFDRLKRAEQQLGKATSESIGLEDKKKKAMHDAGVATGEIKEKSGALSNVMNGVGLTSLAASGMMLEFGKGAVEAGLQFQQQTVQIANSANISTKAAQAIGNAFLSTAGTTTFSASEMAGAYSKVAGQLGLTEGHALSAKDALEFMKQATDTAEASGQSLGSTTSTMSKIMQAYSLKIGDVGTTSDVLYNASRLTGQNFSQIGNTMTRMKGQLGAMAPSIKDTSTLMVDLAAHGLTGRQQMGALNSMFNGLLKVSAKTVPTFSQVNNAIKSLPKPMQALATEYANNQISAKDYDKQLSNLSPAMQTYGKTFKSLSDKAGESAMTLNALNITPAQQEMSKLGVHVYTSTGKFVGMRQILGELTPKIAQLHGTQAKLSALQPIFGSNSKKLLGVIQGGTKSWDRYAKAVSDTKARHQAAERAGNTFEGSMKKLHATVGDLKVSLGNALMPAVMSVLHVFMGVVTPLVQWIEHNKKLASMIAIVVGSLAGLVGGVYAFTKVSKGVRGMVQELAKVFGFQAAEQDAAAASTEGLTVAQKIQAMGAKIAAGAQAAFNAVMDANPVVLIVIAVLALIGVFILLYKHSKLVRDIVADVGKAFGSAFKFIEKVALDAWHILDKDVLRPIVKAFDATASAIMKSWHFVDNNFIHPLVSAFTAVVRWLTSHWELVVVILTLPISIAIGIVLAIWKNFHTQIMDIINAVIKFFVSVWNGLYSFIVSVVKMIVAAAEAEWRGLKRIVDWIYNNVIKPIGDFFTWLWNNAIKPAIQAIISFIEMEWNGLLIIVGWINDNIIQPIGNFFNMLWSSYIKPAMSAVVNVVTSGWNDLLSIVDWVNNNLIQPIVNLFKDIPTLISNALSSLGSILMGIFHAAFDAVAAIWNNSVALIPGVPTMSWGNSGGTTKAAVTYSGPTTPTSGKSGAGTSLALHAHAALGGLAAVGRPMLVGERGPEIFVPPSAGSILSNYQSTGLTSRAVDGGGTTLVVNVTMQGHVYGNLDEFAKKLGSHLATNMLPNGGVVLH